MKVNILCDCEVWTLKQWDVRRLKTTEKKFLRRTAGYSSLDRGRNEDIFIRPNRREMCRIQATYG